jgi:hypothetical protein
MVNLDENFTKNWRGKRYALIGNIPALAMTCREIREGFIPVFYKTIPPVIAFSLSTIISEGEPIFPLIGLVNQAILQTIMDNIYA